MVDLCKKRVLVTGGAGFLGSYIVAELRRNGCNEIFAPRSSEYNLTRQAAVDRLFRDVRPHVVIHAAAVVGGIGANRSNPGAFFYQNALMGIHTIEAARVYRAEKTVVLGSICAYPKFTPVPFREDDLWNGYPEETNAPYGIAKKALLVQCLAYREQYGTNAIYLLPVNLYGPRDNFDLESSHVIPALIRKCVEAVENRAREIECWGDGSASREFLYVQDAAEAIVRATQRYDKPEPVNIGSGQEITIRELISLIARIVGFDGRIRWNSSQPNGQPRRCLDVSRAAEAFGFLARTPLEEGLQKTATWYCSGRLAKVAAS